MIVGHGIDITRISRIKRLLLNKQTKFCNRILTMEEHKRISASKDFDTLVRLMSGTWAIKEATFKACYPLANLGWKDIQVFKDKCI